MKDLGTRDEPYDVIGLGFGPSNIALAIASQEIAPDRSCLFLERSPDVCWHEGMLIDGARMQISFLKDLVSLRNLASPFTFLAYQKAKGRLEKFVNLSEFRPTRLEFQDYLRWVGGQFAGMVRYRCAVTAVSPVRDDDGTLSLLRVTATDTATGEVVEYHARNVVHALGGVPMVPAGVATGPAVVHSSKFLSQFPGTFTAQDREWEFAVAGDGQSAGEITHYLLDRYRNARVHLVLPGYSLRATDNNPFANEQFFEANADEFYSRSEENRRDYAARLRNTNYGVVEAGFLDGLYRLVYADEVRGRTRLVVHDGSRLTSADPDGAGVRIGVHSRFGAGSHELRTDGLVLATGYRRVLDAQMYRDVLPYLEIDDNGRPVVSQDHRARSTEELTCGLYVQGLAETTHGLGDTLLSLLPFRSKQIITAIAKDGGSMARAFPAAQDDSEAMVAQIQRCGSGTVVSAGPSEFPVVTRLPLILDRTRGRQGVLFGVLDRTDPMPLSDGGKVLAVFDPDPASARPPAGRPMSVNVRGRVRLVSDQDRITAHLARFDPAASADPPGATVGIEIEIEMLSGRVHSSQELRAVRTENEGQS
ncbi:SidA/IucD/PvdA family monooxygenase [Streptomyces brevispora]|uniref:L-lysine N6-monooxygenase MbtG n=1 Tax=Streptomyces brevispora TaxID=887462 RepID=A0A561V6G4_9ACTN|nr:SidA/IucD/PvdA family monooxygenase [Streptomyces brevispora]TWG07196.1 L-ornithine N5-oxygenase [Streptomyces brevispora]WSC11977.1 SidA/IucD/PvdA family monooxygenase [Streptomyces brevispora]